MGKGQKQRKKGGAGVDVHFYLIFVSQEMQVRLVKSCGRMSKVRIDIEPTASNGLAENCLMHRCLLSHQLFLSVLLGSILSTNSSLRLNFSVSQ